MPDINSGFAPINNARLYYETAGQGQPFVMIHAGVADSRQWNNEFAHFAGRYRVIRFDMRGFGQSEPVPGEFTLLNDLTAFLDYLSVDQPAILMGCSMGGGLAMNYALTRPPAVKALIMVDSAPVGLNLDLPEPPIFAEIEQAFKAGDLDRAAELDTHLWFDGLGRTPAQVDAAMRRLVSEMDRNDLAHEAEQTGKRLPDSPSPAFERLNEIHVPVLIIVGEHDLPYMFAAADFMTDKIPSARKVIMRDAAHLPNLDHPGEFQRIVTEFLDEIKV
jgi:pimeloyl-ACP methyl ester carboxylesterase